MLGRVGNIVKNKIYTSTTTTNRYFNLFARSNHYDYFRLQNLSENESSENCWRFLKSTNYYHLDYITGEFFEDNFFGRRGIELCEKLRVPLTKDVLVNKNAENFKSALICLAKLNEARTQLMNQEVALWLITHGDCASEFKKMMKENSFINSDLLTLLLSNPDANAYILIFNDLVNDLKNEKNFKSLLTHLKLDDIKTFDGALKIIIKNLDESLSESKKSELLHHYFNLLLMNPQFLQEISLLARVPIKPIRSSEQLEEHIKMIKFKIKINSFKESVSGKAFATAAGFFVFLYLAAPKEKDDRLDQVQDKSFPKNIR
jgi:hypothetical protein